MAADNGVVVARGFGWIMLALLAAFMANVVLTFGFGAPGVAGLASGGALTAVVGVAQGLLYVALVALALRHVRATPGRSLREDASRVSAINLFVVRAAFWAVLLVGLADAAVSFLRVEGMLPDLVGSALADDLGRSRFRGPWLHLPLIALGIALAAVTRTLGFQWLALLVVLAELGIVICRFVFSYEQAFMADLVRFWYGALFLFASAYTLLEDGHVRVDIAYAGMSPRAKGTVNALGAVLLGMALAWTILIIGLGGRSSVIASPVLVFEVTQAGFGMYVKYLMAAFLGVFAVSMLIQFVAQFLDGLADRRGEAGARETHAEAL